MRKGSPQPRDCRDEGMMLAVDLATARVRMSRPPLAFTTIVGEIAAVDGAQWDVLAEARRL
jgi:hypothetical protein